MIYSIFSIVLAAHLLWSFNLCKILKVDHPLRPQLVSFVLARGSVPEFWSQPAEAIKYQPLPHMSKGTLNSSIILLEYTSIKLLFLNYSMYSYCSDTYEVLYMYTYTST